MSGKLISIAILLSALVAGAALYYAQVYGYYSDVVADDILLVPDAGTEPEKLAADNMQAIDSDSSPIRYRACFTTTAKPQDLALTYRTVPGATPRNAPRWFDCFDAAALGAEIEAGTARVFLGRKNIAYGVDRLVAVTDAGRGYVWHDLNDCGEKSYDGTVIGEACPPRPASGAE